ncbi:MAG: bacteriocin class II family protein [Lactobacillus sp.]|nr:bacteriocin class II family protein [Lactobacillus sp.]
MTNFEIISSDELEKIIGGGTNNMLYNWGYDVGRGFRKFMHRESKLMQLCDPIVY